MLKVLASLLASFALAWPAFGATRISVAPFTGKKADKPREQLVRALCERAECVPQARVTQRGKPNWRKVKHEKVAFLLTGKVVSKRGKQLLELAALNSAGKPRWKTKFPLAKGKLSEANVENALASLGRVIKLAPAEAPMSEAEPPRVAEPEQQTATLPPPPASPTPPPPPPEVSEPVVRSEPRLPLEREPEPAIPFATVEAGPTLFSRGFVFQGVETGNLRDYRAPLIVAARVQAELYPLARSEEGPLAGLGLQAGYASALGLSSGRENMPQKHPTWLTRLDLGAKWRYSPTEELTLIPQLGIRAADFGVGPAEDGTALNGLPSISYRALNLKASAEYRIPVFLGVTAMVHAAYLPVFSSGEIISKAYFPTGSASGLELGLGGSVGLTQGLDLRLGLGLTSYSFSFQSQAGDTYVASGASDRYLGGEVAVRYAY